MCYIIFRKETHSGGGKPAQSRSDLGLLPVSKKPRQAEERENELKRQATHQTESWIFPSGSETKQTLWDGNYWLVQCLLWPGKPKIVLSINDTDHTFRSFSTMFLTSPETQTSQGQKCWGLFLIFNRLKIGKFLTNHRKVGRYEDSLKIQCNNARVLGTYTDIDDLVCRAACIFICKLKLSV